MKGFSEKIQRYRDIGSHKVHGCPLCQSIQSRIGQKKLYWASIGGILLLLLLTLTHCGKLRNNGKSPEKFPVPVLVAKIRQGNVPVYCEAVGTVTPIESVTVKTQINGRTLKVHFEEGQVVEGSGQTVFRKTHFMTAHGITMKTGSKSFPYAFWLDSLHLFCCVYMSQL